MTYLPHVPYFSYGETLPVVEQGTTDPGGLGYAYANLAALLARNLQDIAEFAGSRDPYVKQAEKSSGAVSTPGNDAAVFISYHHADIEWMDRLMKHLVPLAGRGLSVWSDHDIPAGAHWNQDIRNALDNAKTAVLLVSADYLASDFIANEELPRILNLASARGLRVLWIPVRHSLFEESPISKFQAISDPNKPLSSLSTDKLDATMVGIARKIAESAGRSF